MMYDMMSGWGMARIGLIGILVLVVLILCVAFRARATSGFAQQRSNRDKSRIATRSHKVKIKRVQINSTAGTNQLDTGGVEGGTYRPSHSQPLSVHVIVTIASPVLSEKGEGERTEREG